MASYRLVLSAGAKERVSHNLDASNLSSALALAHRHGNGHPAELWQGDKLVCHIAQDADAGFWTIG